MKLPLGNTIRRTSSFTSKNLTLPMEFMDDYSKDSTIHGVKYFSERKRHWTEKLFWVSIFVLSIVLCVQNVMEIYEKRKTRPVMISFAKSLSPTSEIPFPAVTICSETKAKSTEIDLAEVLSRNNGSFTDDEIIKLKALYEVCDFGDHKVLTKSLNQSEAGDTVISTLDQLMNPLDSMFKKCRYGSRKSGNCKKLFSKTITDEGVCFTFNMLDGSDVFQDLVDSSIKFPINGEKAEWFMDKEYESMKLKVYPRRVMGSGLQSGLSIELQMNKSSLNPGCKRGIRGFRLSLHTPVEIPQMSKLFYSIPLQKQTTIAVKPEMMYSSKDVHAYDPISRQCYFNHERALKFFKIYTKSSCELECLTEQTLATCGCVKFSMPHDNETEVCDLPKLECVYRTELNFTTRDLERKLLEKKLRRDLKHGVITKKDKGFEKLKSMESCNCLPSCASIRYDAEISQTDFMIDEEGKDTITASINIYFKTAHFTRLKRYEIYGFSDFLSSTGGIFGLFLGCSVISIIEILYHLLTYCVKKMKKTGGEINNNIDESTRI